MSDPSIAVTLAITEAMVDELNDYLLGDKLYRQLVVQTPAGTRQPKMTLGALLENLAALNWRRNDLTVDQRARLDDLGRQVALARRSFSGRWTDALARELHAVLGSWRWYLEDAARERKAREDYGAEVRQRNRIALILRELGDDPTIAEDRQELARLDAQLRGMWQGGGFVGPSDEASRYSPDDAWWLFGRPG